MKRCPECRRDYYDDTLLYCLDDGNALLDGPASLNESPTAIIHGTAPPVDPATHPQAAGTDPPRLLPGGVARKSTKLVPYTRWAGILVAALLITAGFAYYKYTGTKNTDISFASAKLTRLTNSGNVVTTAISGDGKWLVYATTDGEQQTLWLQQAAVAGSGTPIVPPGPVTYAGLAFSFDGTYLFYTAYEVEGSTGTLYQVPVLGGTPRRLVTNISGKVSFSPGGKQITYYSREDDRQRLMIANADGSDERELMERSGNDLIARFNQGPSWSPDGRTIATTVGTHSPRSASVASIDLATGEVRYFSPKKFYDASDIIWTPDGRSLLLLANEQLGSLRVWEISYPSGAARQVSTDLNDYSALSIAQDSKSLATVQGSTVSNIWVGNLTDTVLTTQITTGSDQNFQPSWGPDGKIVYTKYCCGNFRDLYITDPQGGPPKQLTTNSRSNQEPVVSPDRRSVVFTSDRSGTWSVWKIDINGADPRQLTFDSDADPSFSPDGLEVVFFHYANTGSIWKTGVDGGTPIPLTDKESNSPRFSPDGKQLICLYREKPKAAYRMALLSSAGGAPIKTFDLSKSYVNAGLRWSPDGRSVLYAENRNGVTNIWAQPIDGSAPKQITNFPTGLIGSFDISPDGKQIAVSRVTSTSDVILITGFEK